MFKKLLITTCALFLAHQSNAMFFPWDEWFEEDEQKQIAQEKFDAILIQESQEMLLDGNCEILNEYLAVKNASTNNTVVDPDMGEVIVIDETKMPRLASIIKKVAENFQIPKPLCAIIPTKKSASDDYNAFAYSSSKISIHEGYLKILKSDELEAVIHHEMSHIKRKHSSKRQRAVSIVICSISSCLFFIAANYSISNKQALLLIYAYLYSCAYVYLKVSRIHEKEADIDAARAMGTNIPSINLEKKTMLLEKNAHIAKKIIEKIGEKLFGLLFGGFTHPSYKQRIEYLEKLQLS